MNNKILDIDEKNMNSENSAWKSLYRIGGIAALLAVFVFRRNLGAELWAFNGFGLFTVPETMPARAAEWFALLQSDSFVGLTLLNIFDLVEYALLGLIFLAACAALWQTSRSATLLATVCGLAGIIVYFASNQAFAMFALSEQYAAAITEAQHAGFLAAGEALLALHEHGTGIYISLFLVLLAGLIISVVMLNSNVFSKATAVTGILANGFNLAYFIVLPCAPTLLALPFVLAAPFRITWYFLIVIKLFKLGKKE
jgi:hypothetical protein